LDTGFQGSPGLVSLCMKNFRSWVIVSPLEQNGAALVMRSGYLLVGLRQDSGLPATDGRGESRRRRCVSERGSRCLFSHPTLSTVQRSHKTRRGSYLRFDSEVALRPQLSELRQRSRYTEDRLRRNDHHGRDLHLDRDGGMA
jgi:hypothetical protein